MCATAAPRRYLSDLVIAALQDAAYASLGPPFPQDDPEVFSAIYSELPPPMLPENEALASECLVGGALEAAVVPELSSVRPPVAAAGTRPRRIAFLIMVNITIKSITIIIIVNIISIIAVVVIVIIVIINTNIIIM